MKKLLLILGIPMYLHAQNRITVSGYVKEKSSKEQLMGVNVYGSGVGTSTNTYGFYSLSLPKSDSINLVFSYVGYRSSIKKINGASNQKLDILLEGNMDLDEVVISARQKENYVSQTPLMSKIAVPIEQIKKLPTLLGEKDVLKVLQLLPGVQKGSEGQSGLYVRGGGPDQNLIIVDDATVYNASHLFGFFSTFNGDAIKSVELTKGGFPARYGGRLSSVIDINMKDGNKEKMSGEGGVGLISSRVVLEGPINKKSSFIVSGRRTYQDVFAKPFLARRNRDNENKVNGGYFFYDFNGKLNYELGANNKVYLSGYMGKDEFGVDTKSPTTVSNNGINWGNRTGTLRWNHLYNQRVFSNTSLIYSNYKFKINGYEKTTDSTGNVDSEFTIGYFSGIRDWSLKHDVDWYPNNKHSLKMGIVHTYHLFTPEASVIQGGLIDQQSTKTYTSQESGIYAEDSWQPTSSIKVNGGIRLSNYSVRDQNYANLEPRLAVAYRPVDTWAIKASYARMNQYLHLLSNTGLGLPTDLWVPATAKVKPQQSDQWAAGIAKDINSTLSFTVEGYHKTMKNIVNYKEGASFLDVNTLNPDPTSSWEDKITTGNGYSYGAELLLQKKQGRLSGWLGYTWSKTVWTFKELNFGKPFFPKYDRRHDVSIVSIYELTKKITLSGVWVYGTGNALTIPISEYTAQSSHNRQNRAPNENDAAGWRDFNVNEYGDKNSFRAEAYHRLDLGIQFHKQKKKYERTWDVSFYNAYNRKNPFFYTVGTASSSGLFGNNGAIKVNTPEKIVMKRYSLFPIVPSISYNFKF